MQAHTCTDGQTNNPKTHNTSLVTIGEDMKFYINRY